MKTGRVWSLQELLLIDDDPNEQDKRHALEFVIEAARKGHGDVVAQLLAKWPALISAALSEAASHNQFEIVTQLLAMDPTLLDRQSSWRGAASKGYDEMLNLMLSYNPSLVDDAGTALTTAAMAGHESTVALLLAKRPELINATGIDGRTALHCAVTKQCIVKQLLDHKPEVINAVSLAGSTALHEAASRGSTEVIGYLLERKPELSDVLDACGQNALHLAAFYGRGEAFFKLLAQNPRSIDVVASRQRSILYFATAGYDAQVLETVLTLRPKLVFWVDSYNNTALHFLCEKRANLLEPFLERIWELNPSALQAVNRFSKTPLMCSASSGRLWGLEFFTRKSSWDEMLQAHKKLKKETSNFEPTLQAARRFAEEQCESALSSVLFISGLIGIVKEYFFKEPRRKKENLNPSAKGS